MTRPPERPRDFGSGRSASGERASRSRRERRGRRTDPLAASWSPLSEVDSEPDSGRDSRHAAERGGLGQYGWRVYAVPLLVVITALAVFQTMREPRAPQADAPSGPQAPANTPPPPPPYDANMFSADLPPGPPIPVSGGRTFDVQPGTSPRIGNGKEYKYSVEVESGVQLADGNKSFADFVQQTLSDPRSWTSPQASGKRNGLSVQRVDSSGDSPDFRVTLVSQQTARDICGFGRGLPFDTSCRISSGKEDRVYINAARWVRGAVAFHGDLETYRRYAVNHEVGHAFGHNHVPCPGPGAPAPVMMQQTLTVSNNELHDLNKAVDQGTPIPANGFVCKPNAWPQISGTGH